MWTECPTLLFIQKTFWLSFRIIHLTSQGRDVIIHSINDNRTWHTIINNWIDTFDFYFMGDNSSK